MVCQDSALLPERYTENLSFMYVGLQKRSGSGFIVTESSLSPYELEHLHDATYVIGFATQEAAEAKRDQLCKNSDASWQA